MAKLNQATSLALAAVFALATVALVYYYKGQPQGLAGQAQGEKTAEIVVARETISPRATIKPEMLARRPYGANQLPDGAIRDLDGAIGKVATRQIPSGMPVTADLVADMGPALGMSGDLKDTRRGMAVAIDQVSGVAGYMKPGDRVDVLATYSGHDADVSRVVLQDIEILAIGNEPANTANAREKPNATAEAVTATLAVNPDQMSILALVQARAKIHLALRSLNDHAYVPPASITTAKVFGGPALPAPTVTPAITATPIASPVKAAAVQSNASVRITPRPENKPPAPRKTVVVTRGTQTEDVPVQ